MLGCILCALGKVVQIPDFLRTDPPPPDKKFVWQVMSERGSAYLQDRLQQRANTVS